MTTLITPAVIDLTDRSAADPALTGRKAAVLAQASALGLPTLGGSVLTTAFSAAVDAGADIASHPAVRTLYQRFGDRRPLVVRSSSISEDEAGSSMAGQFASVIGVRGFDAFVDAVRTVLDSRTRVGAAGEPIGVLVQLLIEPRFGGVLFGIDPVTGRSDHRVISAVEGGPEPLVSGVTDGSRYVLDEAGTVIEFHPGDGPELPPEARRGLLGLGHRVAECFGGPQDVEWAIDQDGLIWLLQSRPVTTEARGVPEGPVYGPGPVAETFPEALTELEQDLWVPPLREGISHAVRLAGGPVAALDDGEIVVVVDGRVAIDLRLAGAEPEPRLRDRVNPLPSLRRLRGAWRVGRLRVALPRLAENLLDRVDADLEAVPSVDQLTSRQLVALLERGRSVLRALHAHEILMGMLTDVGPNRLTGASVALRVLSEARRDGMTDDEILARSPIVLALTPPTIGPGPTLPADYPAPDAVGDGDHGSDAGILREALRVRARWMQELTGRAAWHLGERLAANGELPSAEAVRHLHLDDLEAIVTKRATARPDALRAHAHVWGDPLPARFQLSDRGRPIAALRPGEVGGGTGAGGGVGQGPVTHDVDDPPIGSVLVTTTLTPGLGPVLPRLAGIVSETGSVLSHLAILAREARVPIVVGHARAVSTFVDGTVIEVDGDSGEVTVVEVQL